MKKNLVLLTAKEHYLCHWLLVKRYEDGSIERKKMIKAWFMMSAKGTNLQRSEINMNTYAKYKYELGKVMSDAQAGRNNSCYGLHWYTNIDTGVSKKFNTKPNNSWFLGRNLFRGEHYSIPYMKNKKVSNSLKNYYKTHEHINKGKRRTSNVKNKIIAYNIYTLEKLICIDSFIPKDYITPYKKAYEKIKK